MKIKILKAIKPYRKCNVLADLPYYLTSEGGNPTPAVQKALCKVPINRILSLHKIL